MRTAPGWEFASASLGIQNANSASSKGRGAAGVQLIDEISGGLAARQSGKGIKSFVMQRSAASQSLMAK